MNTPVSFNIAKLLKEKGFDGNTYYDTVGWRALVWYHIDYKDLHPYEFFGSFNNMVKAPTISDVVMWIYEKHKIWISVFTMDKWLESGNEMEQIFDYDIKQMKFGLINIPKKFEEYNTSTEAYTAAIEYTLKKLVK